VNLQNGMGFAHSASKAKCSGCCGPEKNIQGVVGEMHTKDDILCFSDLVGHTATKEIVILHIIHCCIERFASDSVADLGRSVMANLPAFSFIPAGFLVLAYLFAVTP
jgi:hypothetical protein